MVTSLMRLFCAAVIVSLLAPGSVLAQPTWSKDVLPVVQQRCQGCHTTGGVAPFSLETYGEAASLDAKASTATLLGTPAWRAAPMAARAFNTL